MMTRNDPLLAKLPREVGKRESRYMHLFSGDEVPEEAVVPLSTRTGAEETRLQERVGKLEEELESVKAEIQELKELLDGLTS